MPQEDKALLYTPLLGQVAPLPQHEKNDGSMALTGEKNPLPVQVISGNSETSGGFTRLSTEPKPTATDGAKDGSSLVLVDTGQVFKYYKNEWWEL